MSDNPDFRDNQIDASKLGCLLLHRNETADVNTTFEKNHINPYCMIRVNMRNVLNPEKLLPVETEIERSKNLLWQMVTSVDSFNSPLSGEICCVLTTFEEVQSTSNLNWVHGDETCFNLSATPAGEDTFKHALQWLCGMEFPSDAHLSVFELASNFIEQLNKSNIPNGSVQDLTKFISERTWDGSHLWGGTKEEILETVEKTEKHHDKWRILRLFINFNMAWQTRLFFSPIDGLHRCAASDMAYNGLFLPGSAVVLKNQASKFFNELVPSDDGNSRLCIATESKGLKIIDCSVKFSYRIPNDLGASFKIDMMGTSMSVQARQGKLSHHNIVHVLGAFLDHFGTCVTSKQLGYLYHPGDKSKGIEATLCGMTREGSTKNAFRELLVRDGLCDDDSWASTSQRIEGLEKWNWTDEDKLSNVYLQIWIEKFSEVAYNTLKEICPKFDMVDPEVKLGLISDMTLDQFKRMFQTHHNKTYPKEGALNSYRLDADQVSKDPVGMTPSLRTLVDGDPYKKPLRLNLPAKEYPCFPSHLLEFVWLLLYAHLSEESFNSILRLTKPPAQTQEVKENTVEMRLARRYLRCVIFTISASCNGSFRFWRFGYCPKDRTGKSVLANKMPDITMKLFLMLSAITHTCPFFAKNGINPKMTDVTEGLHDWIVANDCEEFEELVQDPLLMYTLAFRHRVFKEHTLFDIHHNKKDSDIQKRFCCKTIDITLRNSTGNRSITTYKGQTKHPHDHWLGHYTLGGIKTLSMSPDPKRLKELSEKKGHLLEVLGNDFNPSLEDEPLDSSKHLVTHRISQFSSRKLNLKSFFDYLISKYGRKQKSVSGEEIRETLQDENPNIGSGDNITEEEINFLLQDSPGLSPRFNISTADDPPAKCSATGAVEDSGDKTVHKATVASDDGEEDVNEEHDIEDIGKETFQTAHETSVPDNEEGITTNIRKRKPASQGKGRKPRGRKVQPEDDNTMTAVGEADDGEAEKKPPARRKRNPSLQFLTKSLLKGAPPELIDLTGESDDEEIEKNLAGMDDKVKNKCLFVLIKFLNHVVQDPKVNPPKRPRNPFIDDEAACNDPDASPDEESENTGNLSNFFDNSVQDEEYLPDWPHVGKSHESEDENQEDYEKERGSDEDEDEDEDEEETDDDKEDDKDEEKESEASDNESNRPVLAPSRGKQFRIGLGKRLIMNSQEEESEQNKDNEEVEGSNTLVTENSDRAETYALAGLTMDRFSFPENFSDDNIETSTPKKAGKIRIISHRKR